MAPDITSFMTQGLVCISTGAILMDLHEMADAFVYAGGAFIAVYCVLFASLKYRGELHE